MHGDNLLWYNHDGEQHLLILCLALYLRVSDDTACNPATSLSFVCQSSSPSTPSSQDSQQQATCRLGVRSCARGRVSRVIDCKSSALAFYLLLITSPQIATTGCSGEMPDFNLDADGTGSQQYYDFIPSPRLSLNVSSLPATV
jgi:hypothetical protein